jgi:Fur family ferric uptake transcriptional regulator
MVGAEAIVDAFAEAGYRVTEPRRALASLIAAHRGRFTTGDLVREAAASRVGVGRATIFRSLEVLEELGFLEQIALPGGGHGFVACAPTTHHHHLLCSRCGRSADIAATGLSSILRDIATRSGYRIDSHRLEVFGLCPDCRSAAPRKTGN